MNFFVCCILKVTEERNRSADPHPPPPPNVMDLQHCSDLFCNDNGSQLVHTGTEDRKQVAYLFTVTYRYLFNMKKMHSFSYIFCYGPRRIILRIKKILFNYYKALLVLGNGHDSTGNNK
jgi:hypothetical protein